MYNPLKSRRFVTLLVDTVITLLLWTVGRFAPQYAEDLKFLIITIQPIFIFLIGAYTVEDVAIAKKG